VLPQGEGEFVGLPLTDAAFHPGDRNIAYVVPVQVSVPQQGEVPSHTYRAAAKLSLDAGHPGQYSLVRLYGMDPWADSNVSTTPPDASPYDVQKLREIEISRDGANVFVTASQGLEGKRE